ncbi:MAG: FUN14 domain-containing protein, partial [Candidatus Bathyarchaeota archaeon]|nr:FUN14 domain-containing protein [Candidatus Bathyarchaeota archaeon]
MVSAPLDELFASVLFQLVIGGVGGFLIGILIRKVVKLALVIGLIVFAVIILAYTNIIDIDYNSLSDA